MVTSRRKIEGPIFACAARQCQLSTSSFSSPWAEVRLCLSRCATASDFDFTLVLAPGTPGHAHLITPFHATASSLLFGSATMSDFDFLLSLTLAPGTHVSFNARDGAVGVAAQVAAGADANGLCRWSTPLMVAARARDHVAVAVLLAAGADVHAKAHIGRTALMNAAEVGDKACVAALLAAGACVNDRDDYCGTALMRAAAGGYSGVLSLLLSAGATVSGFDFAGQDSLYLAERSGSHACVDMLMGAGADPYACFDL